MMQPGKESPLMTWNRVSSTRILSVTAGMIVSTALLAACGSSGANGADGPVKVGVAGPMNSVYGQWQKTATQIAADEINAGGGINGRKVELVWADTEANPTKAVTEFTRLTKQDKVDFIVGPSTSGETVATLPIVNQAKIATMPSAGSEEITASTSPYSFAVLPTSDQQIEKMVEHITKKGYKKVAVIHDDGVLAVEAAGLIKDELGKAGVTFTGDQSYKLSTTDVTPQVLALRGQSPDALIAWTTTGQDTGRVLQARQQNSWNVPVIGNTAAMSVADAEAVAGKNAFDNVTAVSPAAFAACSPSNVRKQTAAFIEAAQKKASASPGELSYYYMSYFYDGLTWLAAASNAVGSTDGAKVSDWIANNANKADSLPLAGTGWGMSTDNRHAFSVEGVALAEPGPAVSEGIYKSVDCS